MEAYASGSSSELPAFVTLWINCVSHTEPDSHAQRPELHFSPSPIAPSTVCSAGCRQNKCMDIDLLQPGDLFPRRKFQPYSGSWGGSHDPDLASPASVALAWWRGFHSFWTDRIDASAAELSLCRWVGGGMKGGGGEWRGVGLS